MPIDPAETAAIRALERFYAAHPDVRLGPDAARSLALLIAEVRREATAEWREASTAIIAVLVADLGGEITIPGRRLVETPWEIETELTPEGDMVIRAR